MTTLAYRAGAVFWLGFALACPALAAPTDAARTAIGAAYAGMDRATASRNASGYAAYLAPDFAGFDTKGTALGGRAKTLQALAQAFAQVSAAKSATRIVTLSLQDGGAVVTTQATLTLSGTKQGQPFVLKSDDQTRDFWVKSGGRWLLKRERGLSAVQTLNGHILPAAP